MHTAWDHRMCGFWDFVVFLPLLCLHFINKEFECNNNVIKIVMNTKTFKLLKVKVK